MIESISIRNFKAIHELLDVPMAQVTLITGANNTGKTSLLEAIDLSRQLQDPQASIRSLGMRGQRPLPSNPADLWAPLFADFDAAQEIRIDSTERVHGEEKVENASFAMSFKTDSKMLMAPGPNAVHERGPDSELLPGRLEVEAEWAQGYFRGSHSITAAGNLQLFIESLQQAKSTRGNSILVHAGNTIGDPESMAFGQLERDNKTGELVALLQRLEPAIQDLALIPIQNKAVLHVDVGLKTKIPIHQMGRGLHRLVSFALATMILPGAIALIDEIENGIYYEQMKSIWQGLVTTSKANGGQIIATTHSFECIAAAWEALSEMGSKDFQLLRLERDKNGIRAVPMDADDIQVFLDSGWEAR
ncbi:MAG: hypothetical protein CSA62_06630 [Planctomycetota bacterium]|nr:MAG: hypothetical protein CSA62_06630 [Planctomycetota bacterium]